jgi:hypothetical protein
MADEGIAEDDEVKAILDLTEAGYGQVALKGRTREGHRAEIKKGAFYDDKDKNLQSLERPKQLRVSFDTTHLSDRAIQKLVATTLRAFYGKQ